MTTPSEGGPPGESPAEGIVRLVQRMQGADMHNIVAAVAAALDRRGEEERAARDANWRTALQAQDNCGHSMWRYERDAQAPIFSPQSTICVWCTPLRLLLAAAPSGDAFGLNWYQRADGYWNADCGCGSTLCGWEAEQRAHAEAGHAEVARQNGFKGCGPRAIAKDPTPSGDAKGTRDG